MSLTVPLPELPPRASLTAAMNVRTASRTTAIVDVTTAAGVYLHQVPPA